MTTLLVQTASPIVACGLRALFSDIEDIRLAAVVTSIEDLLNEGRACGTSPVVLLDCETDLDAAAVSHLIQCVPSARSVLYVQAISDELAHYVRETGVHGILRKDTSVELMLRCIRKVAEGEMWFERSLLKTLLHAREVTLSPREAQLLALVSKGWSNKQIAASLLISEGTVKAYFFRLFKKTGVSDRFELALYGLRRNGKALSGQTQCAADTQKPVRFVVMKKPESLRP